MPRFLLALLLALVAACGGQTKDAARIPEYVYVVDSADGSTEGNQVIVVNPETRSVVTTIPATYSIDAVVDPNGGRLFVTRWGEPDLVDEYDTSDWSQAGTFNIDERYHETIYPPAADWLKVSPDGKLLYYLKYGTFHSGCGPCNSYIAAVNLQTGESALNLLVDKCSLLSIDVDDSNPIMYTACSQSIGSQGGATLLDLNTGVLTSVSVPEDIWSTLRDAQHHKWYLLTRSMSLYIVDTARAPNALTVSDSIDLNPDDEPAIEATTATLSPDGSRFYVAVTTDTDRLGTGQADEIWGFDTKSWERVARIRLASPALHFAVSLDGRTIYSVNPDKPELTFTDVESGDQTTATGVGVNPAKILVAPK